MRPRFALASFAVASSLLLAATDASAQCPSVTFQQYGTGCNPLFDVPVLAGSFDPGKCTVTIDLGGFPGCCNTFLQQRIFAVGLAPAAIPTGIPGCLLEVLPVNFLVVPGNVNSFEASVPPGAAGTLYLQGVNQYFTTIGFTTDYTFSNGLKIDAV